MIQFIQPRVLKKERINSGFWDTAHLRATCTSSSFRLFMNFFAINIYNYHSVAIRRFKLERAPFARQMDVTDN